MLRLLMDYMKSQLVGYQATHVQAVEAERHTLTMMESHLVDLVTGRMLMKHERSSKCLIGLGL